MTTSTRGPAREGYLVKSPPRESAFFSKWQRRWVVLSRVGGRWTLRYYKDATSLKEKGSIMGNECLQVSRVQGHPKHSFLFSVSTTKRRYLFAASSKEELEGWVGDLSEKFGRTAHDVEVCWEYQTIDGMWYSYSNEECEKLEHMYQENVKGFDMKRRDSLAQIPVSVDLGHMTETYKKGGATRRIRRRLRQVGVGGGSLMMKNCNYAWMWKDDHGQWRQYPRVQSNHIELMYQAQAPIFVIDVNISSVGKQSVLINFANCEQINPVSGEHYEIRRQTKESLLSKPIESQDEGHDLPNLESAHQPTELNTYTDKFHQSKESTSIVGELMKFAISHADVELMEELGHGAFGEVFKAVAQNIPGHSQSKVVAVKVLKGDADEQSVIRVTEFLKEACVMAKFDHPNVMSLLAVCLREHPVMIVSHYMNHGDLLGFVRQSVPQIEVAVKMSLSKQIAEGMHYLSAKKNFIHRDLAARNVLVNEEGDGFLTAKITDFGLSRDLYSSEVYQLHFDPHKEVRLPAKWMAVESLETFVFTTKSDVWGFGVVLWEIFSNGLQPYPHIKNRHMLHELQHGAMLECPPECPVEVYHVVLDCCKQQPEDRPNFAWLAHQMVKISEQLGYLQYQNVDCQISEKERPLSKSRSAHVIMTADLHQAIPSADKPKLPINKPKPKVRPKPRSTSLETVHSGEMAQDSRSVPLSSLDESTRPSPRVEMVHGSSILASEQYVDVDYHLLKSLPIPTTKSETKQLSSPTSVAAASPIPPRRAPWTMTHPTLEDVYSSIDVDRLSKSQLMTILRDSGDNDNGSEGELRSRVASLVVALHQRRPEGPYHVTSVGTKKMEELHDEDEIRSLSIIELRQVLRQCGAEVDGSEDHCTLTSRLTAMWSQYASQL